MILLVEILFRLIMLHDPEGKVVWINPETVVSLRAKGGGGHLQADANCLINLNDGKFVAVVESCEAVDKMLEENK